MEKFYQKLSIGEEYLLNDGFLKIKRKYFNDLLDCFLQLDYRLTNIDNFYQSHHYIKVNEDSLIITSAFENIISARGESLSFLGIMEKFCKERYGLYLLDGKDGDENHYYLYLIVNNLAYLVAKSSIEKIENSYQVSHLISFEVIFGMINFYLNNKLISPNLIYYHANLLVKNNHKPEVIKFAKEIISQSKINICFVDMHVNYQLQKEIIDCQAVLFEFEVNEKLAKNRKIRVISHYNNEIVEVPFDEIEKYLVSKEDDINKIIYKEMLKENYLYQQNHFCYFKSKNEIENRLNHFLITFNQEIDIDTLKNNPDIKVKCVKLQLFCD